jgi:hypothetical protein
MLYSHYDIHALERIVNDELGKACLWLEANKLTLNITRKYMHAETLALLTKPLYFPNMKYLK